MNLEGSGPEDCPLGEGSAGVGGGALGPDKGPEVACG